MAAYFKPLHINNYIIDKWPKFTPTKIQRLTE